MILVDSNIIIDFWKNPSDMAKEIFLKQEIFICGVVKAELLHGAKDQLSYNKIEKALKSFPEANIGNSFWDDLSGNLFKLKKRGISIPFQDSMIATIAIANDLYLWTNDKYFQLIKQVLSKLLIYNPNR